MPRQRVASGSPFEEQAGFCRAVRVGDRVLVAGTAPIEDDGSVAETADGQGRRCFSIIETALREAGSSLDDVVRTRMFLVDAADFDAVAAVHGELFGETRPVATAVVVAALLDPRWKIEIEAEAIIDTG